MRLIYSYILLFLLSCNYRSSTTKLGAVKDTITVDKNYIADKNNCKDFTGLYYTRFGIAISKYYVVNDSLGLDLNKDGKTDTIVILSPVLLEDSYTSCGNYSPKRILVEILNSDDGV